VTKPPLPRRSQPEDSADEQVTYARTGIPLRVSVKTTGEDHAVVVVTVVQGMVWLSIMPPFTWEAIMEPGNVDELIRVLELAREEAQKMAAMRGRRAVRGNEVAVRAIGRSGSIDPVTPDGYRKS
jgi:hypothetical protein